MRRARNIIIAGASNFRSAFKYHYYSRDRRAGAAGILLSRFLARKRREAERIANLKRNEMIKARLRETPPSAKAARRGA